MKMNLPEGLKNWIGTVETTDIDKVSLSGQWIFEKEGQYLFTIQGQLTEAVQAGSWCLSITPDFDPDFFYTPHLTPDEDSVIDMHVFRAPVLMMGRSERVLCVLPVMDGVENGDNRWFMDLNAPKRKMTLGITTTERSAHVLYRSTEKAVLPAGEFSFSVRVMLLEGEAAKNPFRPVLAWYWQNYGRSDSRVLPECSDLMRYVEH